MVGGIRFKSLKMFVSGQEQLPIKIKFKRLILVLLSLLGFFLCSLGYLFFEQLPFLFPIHHVIIIDPPHQVNQETVRRSVLPLMTKGFFGVNIEQIQSRLNALNWVQETAVSRRWPDTLIIKLSEYRPVARWHEQALVTAGGVIFLPNPSQWAQYQSLPDVEVEPARVTDALTALFLMQTVLKPIHLSIEELTLTPRLSWSLMLNNQAIIKLGEQRPTERLKRFVSVYSDVFPNDRPLVAGDYVDLRYDHGMAVYQGSLDTHNKRT